MTSGSVDSYLMVAAADADAAAARDQLIARGVAASKIDEQPWGTFVSFKDRDGNAWTLQQLPPKP